MGGSEGSQRLPSGVTTTSQACPDYGLYVADYGHHRIVRLTTSGVVATIAGTGAPGFGGDGGPASGAALNGPACVLVAPGGVLFVCDRENHVVRRIAANGTITTIAGVPQTPGFTGDGPATTVRLNRPSALARAADGELLVVDAGNGRLRRIDPATGALTTVAFGLNDPHDVAIAADGTIVVAETGGHRVRRVGAGGTLAVVAGDGIPFFGGDGGPALDATLTQPKSVALAADGGLLVADAGNGRVRHVDPDGVIRTVAGSAVLEPLGDGGLATSAGIRNPSDAIVDAAGRLVVSDTDHDRIRRVGPGGNIATLALASHPTGVEPDGAGNVYVADFDAHRVVRVAPNGAITPIAGNGTPGAGGDGGPALQASLTNPTDLDVDDAGNLRSYGPENGTTTLVHFRHVDPDEAELQRPGPGR